MSEVVLDATGENAAPLMQSFSAAAVNRGLDCDFNVAAARFETRVRTIVLLLVACVIGLELTGLNLWVSQLLFSTTTNWWYLRYDPVLENFDRVAPLVGLLTGLGSFVWGCHLSRRTRDPIPFRNGLFMLVVLIVGPGLMVNLFKTFWGRPRPADLTVFGGVYPYLKCWTMGFDTTTCRSFPSGHASIGFYMLTPAFLCFRDSVRLRNCLVTGSVFAVLVSGSRVLQGSHFVTDVLCSAIMTLTTGMLLHSVIFNPTFVRRLQRSPAGSSGLGRDWIVHRSESGVTT